jgi:hypothetical protein
MKFRGSFSLLVLFALITASLSGQVSTSRLTGSVQDASGAAVAGAKITIRNEQTGVTRTATLSDSGVYTFDAIATGLYTVEVEAAGFKKVSLTGNEVRIGQPTTVNATLEVGQLTETVEVSGGAEVVQTSTSGNYGNVLTEKVIQDLPIVGTRGRNPLNLVMLQPGTFDGANTGGGFHVHGARDRAWNFTLDGIDNNDPSAGGSNFAPTRTNPDSLSEFRVVTSNPTADVGRNSGANVLLVTKSGTNEFHGNAFWFYRTPRLNANEWANNFNKLGKRQFVQNIYGGSVGGPIWRNKTFFFVNIQRLAASETRSVNRLTYTADARRGLLRYVSGGRNRPAGQAGASVDAAGNPVAGLSIATYNVVASDPQRLGIDKTIAAAVAKLPLPNNFTGGDGLNTAYYTWSAPVTEKQQDNTIRIDHQLNAKHSFFGRGSWGYQDSVCDAANSGTAFFPDSGCNVNTERGPKNIAASWRYIVTPTIVNEFIFGHSDFTFNFVSPQAAPGKIFFQGGDGGGTVANNLGANDAPVLVENLSYAIGNLRTIRTRQFVDNLTFVRKEHTFKTGVNLRFVQHADIRGSVGGANANTTVNFSPGINTVNTAAFGIPADLNVQFDRPEFERNINFLLGRVGSISRGFASDGQRYVEDLLRVKARYGELEFYFQDTWKIRRNLTVDLGLRWELRNAPAEASNLIASPNQALVYGAPPTLSATWNQGAAFYKRDWNNLGPSIGVAWDPFGKGKTSIRTNYRIAFDRLPTFGLSTIFQTLPGITLGVTDTTFGQNGGRLANLPAITPPNVPPASLAQPVAYTTNTITVVDPNIQVATTNMWALGIQHEILPRTVLSVDYIGRRAYNLYGSYNANQTEIFRNGFLDAFKAAQAGGESPLLDQLTRADTRRTATESGAAFLRRQFSSDLALGAVATVAQNLGQRFERNASGATVSATSLSGLGPFFFFPFPQFGQTRVIDSNDFSTYHGLEVQILRRMSKGLEAQFSWTWSKSLDTRSYDPSLTLYGTGSAQSATSHPFDIANRRLNYARSDFDRRHVLNSYWIWEAPVGRGRRFGPDMNRIVDGVIGGWSVAGFLRYQTGRPFTVFSGALTSSNVVQSTAQCSGCSPTDGHVFTNSSGTIQFFDQATRDKLVATPAGSTGSTGRNFFNLASTFDMDVSLSKRFRIQERVELQVRADAVNVTNTPLWDVPTAVRTSGTFGAFTGPSESTGSRKIQLGAKINF